MHEARWKQSIDGVRALTAPVSMAMGREAAPPSSGSNSARSAAYAGSSSNDSEMTASVKIRKGSETARQSCSALVPILVLHTMKPLFSPYASAHASATKTEAP